jgi:hypothetical protein
MREANEPPNREPGTMTWKHAPIPPPETIEQVMSFLATAQAHYAQAWAARRAGEPHEWHAGAAALFVQLAVDGFAHLTESPSGYIH